MIKANIFLRVFCAILLINLLGCSVTSAYDIVIKNVGSKPVDEASVSYGEFKSVGGYISPGRSKGHMDPGYPLPDIAIVEWRSEDGELHQKEVAVKKYVPRSFRGDIQFEINDKNEVAVKAIRDTY